MYTYNAIITKVVDGDTIHAQVDLGFRTFMELDFRLKGINAPEMNTQAGKDAKAHIEVLLGDGKVAIQSFKSPDKYGRWLAVIFNPSLVVSVNQTMIDDGFAVPYMA